MQKDTPKTPSGQAEVKEMIYTRYYGVPLHIRYVMLTGQGITAAIYCLLMMYLRDWSFIFAVGVYIFLLVCIYKFFFNLRRGDELNTFYHRFFSQIIDKMSGR